MDITKPNELQKYFETSLNKIKVSQIETREYIKGILYEYLKTERDLSRESIVLAYYNAKTQYNFEKFKETADWIFWLKSVYPQHLENSGDLYSTIAQNSYYRCHIILNKQWPLFDEMADRFEYFTNALHENIFIPRAEKHL